MLAHWNFFTTNPAPRSDWYISTFTGNPSVVAGSTTPIPGTSIVPADGQYVLGGGSTSYVCPPADIVTATTYTIGCYFNLSTPPTNATTKYTLFQFGNLLVEVEPTNSTAATIYFSNLGPGTYFYSDTVNFYNTWKYVAIICGPGGTYAYFNGLHQSVGASYSITSGTCQLNEYEPAARFNGAMTNFFITKSVISTPPTTRYVPDANTIMYVPLTLDTKLRPGAP